MIEKEIITIYTMRCSFCNFAATSAETVEGATINGKAEGFTFARRVVNEKDFIMFACDNKRCKGELATWKKTGKLRIHKRK